MLKISDAVRDILFSSEIAMSAFEDGVLNLSAYAKTIRKEAERRTKKPVKTGSIVVALSRIRRESGKRQPLVPDAEVEDLSVKSGLAEISFDRTRAHLARLRNLYRDPAVNAGDFFMVTQGTGEITIVALTNTLSDITTAMRPLKPKAVIKDLVGLTVRFKQDYISVPNIIFAFVRQLALRRINIVEIVSTYTELTFIVSQRDLHNAFLALNELRASKMRAD